MDLKKLEAKAVQGDAFSQFQLGSHYCYRGAGAQPDYTKAIKWYRLAAEQGDADAQYELAVLYESGEGVPQDCTEAAKSWGA